MAVPGGETPQRRIAFLLEYEGTRYAGSQYQTNRPTIQAALERAISNLTGESNRVALAGRTDAGVHASGQVASVLTASSHAPDVFLRAVNFYLPEDIVVKAAVETPLRFDVRRRAVARWYRYTIYQGSVRPALDRRYVWQVEQPLDSDALAEAARSLPGDHDFAAFTRPSLAQTGTVRRVFSALLSRRGPLLVFDIEANAYLMQQVRRIVGALVKVGSGALTVGEFGRLVEDAVPGAAGFVAPPQGLCLMKVRYERELFDHEEHENI